MASSGSQGLEVREISLIEQTIDIDARRVSSQNGQQTGKTVPEGMALIGLNAELLGQLRINDFDPLRHRIEGAADGSGRLVAAKSLH